MLYPTSTEALGVLRLPPSQSPSSFSLQSQLSGELSTSSHLLLSPTLWFPTTDTIADPLALHPVDIPLVSFPLRSQQCDPGSQKTTLSGFSCLSSCLFNPSCFAHPSRAGEPSRGWPGACSFSLLPWLQALASGGAPKSLPPAHVTVLSPSPTYPAATRAPMCMHTATGAPQGKHLGRSPPPPFQRLPLQRTLALYSLISQPHAILLTSLSKRLSNLPSLSFPTVPHSSSPPPLPGHGFPPPV